MDDTHFNPMDTLSTQHITTFVYRTKNPGIYWKFFDEVMKLLEE